MDSHREMRTLSQASDHEISARATFLKLFSECPIPQNEILSNLGLFVRRQQLSRILFMHDLYQKIISVHGIIIEFGVRWGQNLALFSSFRGMYEPFNHNRKVVGFDTFSGFPSVAAQDGRDPIMTAGAFGVTEGYERYLDAVLAYHEAENPVNHIKKYELVKGDASVTLERYLSEHPETIIALAYFDFDLYEPTKKCLELIRPHLTKGSVLGFDELNFPAMPGETLALKEILGLDRYAISRSPFSASYAAFVVVD